MDMMFMVPKRYQIAQMYFTPFEQCLFVDWLCDEYNKDKIAQETAQNGKSSN